MWVRLVYVLSVCLAFVTSGCATVPYLKEDGVAISEIVQRVKCELALAVPEPKGHFPTGPYQWMKDWTAKVDLTLNVDEKSSLNPTTSFIRPMTPETLPGIGSFSRMFAIGAGAALNNTATRSETLSFTVSLQELRDAKYANQCLSPIGIDVYGNLGLKEWIASALDPVDQRLLTIGKHPQPSGKSSTLAKPEAAQTIAQHALRWARYAQQLADQAKDFADNAKKAAARKTVQQTLENVRNMYQRIDEVSSATARAQDLIKIARLEKNKTSSDSRFMDEATKILENVQKQIPEIEKAGITAWTSLGPLNPPIDSIGHKVEFIVEKSGNVTPSWTLVHFKGPGTTGNFAGISRSDRHTLIMALGQPEISSPTGTKNPAGSQEQYRQLLNQRLDALRGAPAFP